MDALPTPRTPDPMQAPALRWGILGPGWIAERFVGSLQRHTSQQVVAVGSRDADRSADFARRLDVPRVHGSYDDLVADPEADVVYVATPHNYHHPHARLAIEAGKHVLVEKPIALNAGQARDLQRLARERGVFCMEALWTLFLPKFDVLRQLLDAGALGEVKTVLADMGEHFGPDHRIMARALAGGPMLDLGTYPVAFATWVLGVPSSVYAAGRPEETGDGVNGQLSMVLATDRGQQAVLHTTVFSQTPTTGVIAGTDAVVTIPGLFYLPGAFRLAFHDGRVLDYDEPAIGHDGLHFQAAEVARRISSGEAESPIRPLADSIATMAVMDEARAQLGIRFDDE